MTKYYQEALDLYGIEQGFVDEQIDSILESLKEKYNPEKYPFLSSEYNELFSKRSEVEMAYSILRTCFRNYIVSKNIVDDSTKEIMGDQILKLVYDSAKKEKDIDEYFISDLVEIIVCNRGLNDYVRQISFEQYRNKSLASYGNNNEVKIYFSNVYQKIRNSTLSGFSTFEKKYNPYCQVVKLIGHELEHANHKRIVDQGDQSDIKTKLLLTGHHRQTKWDKDIEKISKYPAFFFWLASKRIGFLMHFEQRKYQKNWRYSPEERLSEFSGINLALNLIQGLEKKESISLSNLEAYFMDALDSIAFDCYWLTDPTLFYLEKFKQREEYMDIARMSMGLSLEERAILGLQVYPDEKDKLFREKEKIIQKIRSL